MQNRKTKNKRERKMEMLVKHLPSGGKPPAIDDDEGLRKFLDSKFDKTSDSGCLLPVALGWDEFCINIIIISCRNKDNKLRKLF